MPTPELLLGTGGALILAVWVINELWKAHKASDADVMRQRDGAIDRLERVIGLAERGTKDKP